MAKFDDKKTTALLRVFLDQAFRSIAREKSAFEKIQSQEVGFRMSNGMAFVIDQTMHSAENDIVSQLLSRLGPQLGHYSEIANALWAVAATNFSEGNDNTNPKIASECLTKLNHIATSTVQFIHPAYNVTLVEGVNEIRVGPVTIRSGASMVSKLSTQSDKITFGIGEPSGVHTNGGLQYNVSQTMWDVTLLSSSAARLNMRAG